MQRRTQPVDSYESEAFVPSPMSDAGGALRHQNPNAPFVTGLTDGGASRRGSFALQMVHEEAAAADESHHLTPVSNSNSDHTPSDISELFAISMPSSITSSAASSSEFDDKKTIQLYKSVAQNVRCAFSSVCTNASLSIHYTRTDVARRPRNCIMGFIAVFLVVFFTMISLAAISKTTFLLLRFAELSVGEMDAVVYSSGDAPVVNYTAVAERFHQNASCVVSGSSPRWIAKGILSSWEAPEDEGENIFNLVNRSRAPSVAVNVVVIDAAKEPKVGIGRAWPYRQIGYGETHVTDTALDYLSIQSNIGDRATLVVDVKELVSGNRFNLPSSVVLPSVNQTASPFGAVFAEQRSSGSIINVTSLLSPSIDMNVADGITGPYGKYPMSLGNVMVVDYKRLPRLMADQSGLGGSTALNVAGDESETMTLFLREQQKQEEQVQGLLDRLDLSSYALIVVAMFHNRFTTYYKTSAALGRDMIENSNALLLALDFTFPGDIVYPVAAAVEAFQSFNAIITSLFAAIIIIILVLSAILVYSLLGMNGEERQFELAMIRAQGMTRTQLLYIMAGEVAVFVIPGVCCGVGFAIVANAILERVLADFVKAPYEPFRIPAYSYAIAIAAGFAMPILSNWTPVMEAMRASLRDALDVNRQKWSESQVSMLKLGDLGLELWQTLLGLFLTLAGFMVYYLLPMSYIYNNVLIFFMIMNIVLLIMLFGLCLLGFSFQGVVSRAWLWVILRGPDKRLLTLVSKNMEAHAMKSQRAFVMFIIAIASVVFGGIAFQFLSVGMSQLLELSAGADILITSSTFDVPLNRTILDTFLGSQAGVSVAAWSYVTFTLTEYPQIVAADGTGLRNILGSRRSMPVVGVTERYMDTVFPVYVKVGDVAPGYSLTSTSTGVVDVVRSLYDDPSSDLEAVAQVVYTGFPETMTAPDPLESVKTVLPVLVASGLRDGMGLDTSSLAAVEFAYRLQSGATQTTEFLVQPRAMLDRLSGFPGISPRRTSLSSGATITTVDSFMRLVMANATDFAGVPLSPSTALADGYVSEPRFEKLLVRVVSGLESRQRAFLLNSLQAYLDSYHSSATDVAKSVSDIEQVTDVLFVFYYFSAVICVLLATFMTWMVFVSNVTQHAWSFGVLRSLGFTKNQVLRAVVYEALVMVMSSFSLGLPIGLFVGCTLGLQMSTFLNLPYQFQVSYPILLVLLGASMLTTVVGSAIPMRSLNNMQIALVVKKY
jgi:ABC-type antimicrobial peptide transport system permease subunit